MTASRSPHTMIATVVLLLLTTGGCLFGIWRLLDRGGDPDQRALDRERSRRLSLVAAGAALPDTPDPTALPARLTQSGLSLGAPVFIRIFKREFELEVWIKRDDRYQRLAVYPICRFSGSLGPKLIEGDRQSPEGFYTIERRSMNPQSRWHRSFNLGFPNALDRAHHRTGSFLMVHGGCSSVGCYAMTNAVIDELWRLVDAALLGGQKSVQVHVFPFRMTTDNLAARAEHRWSGFWSELKAGYDAFEQTRLPPRVAVCDGHYEVELRNRDAGAGDVTAAAGGGHPDLGCRTGRDAVSDVSDGPVSSGKSAKSHGKASGKAQAAHDAPARARIRNQ